jgi:uncharacterized protein (DUF433 family)
MALWQVHLRSDPAVCGGDLCARGTRIPVTVILDNLAEGSSQDEILRSYPSLRPEHIEAALAYAAELAHEERLIPVQARCQVQEAGGADLAVNHCQTHSTTHSGIHRDGLAVCHRYTRL